MPKTTLHYSMLESLILFIAFAYYLSKTSIRRTTVVYRDTEVQTIDFTTSINTSFNHTRFNEPPTPQKKFKKSRRSGTTQAYYV